MGCQFVSTLHSPRGEVPEKSRLYLELLEQDLDTIHCFNPARDVCEGDGPVIRG